MCNAFCVAYIFQYVNYRVVVERHCKGNMLKKYEPKKTLFFNKCLLLSFGTLIKLNFFYICNTILHLFFNTFKHYFYEN